MGAGETQACILTGLRDTGPFKKFKEDLRMPKKDIKKKWKKDVKKKWDEDRRGYTPQQRLLCAIFGYRKVKCLHCGEEFKFPEFALRDKGIGKEDIFFCNSDCEDDYKKAELEFANEEADIIMKKYGLEASREAINWFDSEFRAMISSGKVKDLREGWKKFLEDNPEAMHHLMKIGSAFLKESVNERIRTTH